MDFGLSKFLEMFEARFGRAAGTIMLGMVGLAVATFTGHMILTGLVIPIYDAVVSFMDGHETFMMAFRNFATTHLNPFFSTVMWIGMLTWLSNNIAHDGYAFYKRRQILRYGEKSFHTIYDRHKFFRWIRDNKEDAREIIARLDNEEAGIGPIVDDHFLLPILAREIQPPPFELPDVGKSTAAKNQPNSSPPSPTPQAQPPET